MKKILYILLALVVVLTFVACSTEEEDDIRGDQIVETKEDAEDDEDEAEETEEVTEGENETTALGEETEAETETKPETDAPETDAAPSVEVSMGEVEGLTYENKYIGLGCKLDASWSFYTDDQIKEMNQLNGISDDDALAEAIENATLLIDMMAVNESTASNLMVSMEKVEPVSLAITPMGTILDNVVNSGASSLETSGFTVLSKTKTTRTVAGETIDAVVFESEMQGIKIYQTMLVKKCKGHLASFTITSYNEDISAELLKEFYIVK